MQYFDAFCRGFYKGFLNFGEVMSRPSSLLTLLAFVLWFAFIFQAPQGVVNAVGLGLAGWYMGGKISELHTYFKKRFD